MSESFVNEIAYDIFDRDGNNWIARCSFCKAERRHWELSDLVDGYLLHDCDLENTGDYRAPVAPRNSDWSS